MLFVSIFELCALFPAPRSAVNTIRANYMSHTPFWIGPCLELNTVHYSRWISGRLLKKKNKIGVKRKERTFFGGNEKWESVMRLSTFKPIPLFARMDQFASSRHSYCSPSVGQ